jgi:hypothetical protein
MKPGINHLKFTACAIVILLDADGKHGLGKGGVREQ